MGHLWKRGKVWYMGYQDRRGKWVQKSTRTMDKQSAKDRLIEAECRVSAGEAKPLAEFLQEYLKQRKPGLSPKSLERYHNGIDMLTYEHSPLANVTLQDLDRAAVTSNISWRLGHGRSRATVGREVTWLKAALDAAAEQGLLSWERAYQVRIKRWAELRRGKRKSKIVLPHEWAAMYEAAAPDLRDIMTVALWTGLRRSNILGLTERHVDFSTDPAVIRFGAGEMKNEAGLTVKLPERVRAVLWGRWTGNPSRRFFEDFRWTWKRFKKRHAPAGFWFHDFRGSYISYRLGAGVDPKTVQAEVSHETSKMTMDVYAKALTDPAVVTWGREHFRFPWDPATYVQDGTPKNEPSSVRDSAFKRLQG